ncbi:tyrosine-type recombinase/integrase [Bradyrhizobium sp. CCBAU 53351]|uniref:tyrosine-type recombinase/integrase n=1 Tax=Bradyrhizobium sp. CCBAU 53351 TaxID=1325114 RepID=UPI00188740F8|nr:tyrosine-type recombinase/integrase [Bradyrhizobium sp. CCBAU 53351]
MAYIYLDTDSSHWNFRLRTPTDVLRILDDDRLLMVFDRCMGEPGFEAQVRIGAVVKLSLRTRNAAVAEIRKAQALAQLAKVWAAKRSEPKRLNLMQIMGLAGLVHDLYVETFQQEPGERADWIAHKAVNRAVREGRLVDVPPIIPGQMPNEQQLALDEFGDDLTAGINALPRLENGDEGLERRYGLLCNWVLAQQCLRVDYATRKRLLVAIAKAGDTGPRQLKENAIGDYSPDIYRERYPRYRSSRTLQQVFEQWRGETQPAPSSVTNWRGHVDSLVGFVGHDHVERLTRADIVSWKDHLVEKGLAAKTINDSYLACIKRLLNYEVENHRLVESVAEKVSVSSRGQAGDSQLPYTTEEVAQLLTLARGQHKPILRWLPWLVALSGSRVGEVAQLWGSSVKQVGNLWVMQIKPADDGGRLKNHWSERETPIHQAIIEEGFLNFVSDRGDGPLFYNRSSGDRNRKHASKSVCNRLGAWIRSQEGFQDPRKAPNHAFRHWFKTELGALGVPDSMADAIMGHGKKSEADKYRHYTAQRKAPFVNKVQVPEVTASSTVEAAE